MAEVAAAEDALAVRAERDLSAGYRDVLAADARLHGSTQAPAVTPEAVDRELATRSPRIRFHRLGGRASAAGDLVWTYGEAVWDGGKGHYVRIWQRRDGWKLVFDQLLTDPPAKS